MQAVTGFGSGSQIVVLPLPGAAGGDALIARARRAGADLAESDGFVQSYLLVPDTGLSTPLPRESTENRQLAPIFMVEASTAQAAQALRGRAASAFKASPSDAWLFELGWKLNAADLR
ncbi:hypothetical protein D9M68_769180 [compost metagenome]